MTSFSEVLDLARSSSTALTALEDAARSRIVSSFALLETGTLTAAALRNEVIKQIRSGYVSAGTLAISHITEIATESGIPPLEYDLRASSRTLERILSDVRVNYTAYRKSEQTEADLRRLRFRTILSAQTAVRKGFTENQISAARVLQAAGASMRKVWLANFVDNVPCLTCMGLHATERGLDEEFPHGNARDPKVYGDLLGPPRHPNCRCYMLIYVVTLETNSVVPAAPELADQKFMTARDVRRLPKAVFASVVATMRMIAHRLKEISRGKR